MKLHRNAKTTPKARAVIVQRVDDEGWSVQATAAAFSVSGRTVYKWRARYRIGALAPWVRYYNQKRPHTALNYRTPISRLEEVAA